jgi:hypothetical protein
LFYGYEARSLTSSVQYELCAYLLDKYLDPRRTKEVKDVRHYVNRNRILFIRHLAFLMNTKYDTTRGGGGAAAARRWKTRDIYGFYFPAYVHLDRGRDTDGITLRWILETLAVKMGSE